MRNFQTKVLLLIKLISEISRQILTNTLFLDAKLVKKGTIFNVRCPT